MPVEFWDAVERHKARTLVIVGDAFARPMLQALEDAPKTYDLSSVVTILSSGVMWTRENKHALLEYMPQAQMVDSFGSSEAVGFGSSIMTKDGEIQTAKFQIGERCKVFDEATTKSRPAAASRASSPCARRFPKGYYKDDEKTAEDLQDHRWRALCHARRLVRGRSRRHADASGPRQRLHQHGRREGLSRGGRGVPEDASRRRGCAGRRRAG